MCVGWAKSFNYSRTVLTPILAAGLICKQKQIDEFFDPSKVLFFCVWCWWWWGRRKSFHLVRILPAGWDRDGFVCRPPFLLCTYPPPAPLPHPPHSYSTNHTLIPFLPPVFLTAPSCPLPHQPPKCKQARTQLPVSFASVQTFSGNDYERAKHFSKYQERFKLALPLPLSNSQI